MKKIMTWTLRALLLCVGVYLFTPLPAREQAIAPQMICTPTLIIDAGHGGEDGGAISHTGALESNINLEIALKLEQVAALVGFYPVMIRSDDVSVYDPGCATIRDKKISDIRNRVRTIESFPSATLVSIHQNTYPEEKYHGFQLFYAPTDGSREIAESMRSSMQKGLNPENKRELKKIPDSIYLMNHITCPAVLVECGFLSNVSEEILLRDEDYQKKLVTALVAGLIEPLKDRTI